MSEWVRLSFIKRSFKKGMNIMPLSIKGEEIVAGKIKGEVISSKLSTVNEILLEAAIKYLHDIDSKEIETIQIGSTKYDDQSRGITIEITYPPEKEESLSSDSPNFLGDIINKSGEDIKLSPDSSLMKPCGGNPV